MLAAEGFDTAAAAAASDQHINVTDDVTDADSDSALTSLLADTSSFLNNSAFALFNSTDSRIHGGGHLGRGGAAANYTYQDVRHATLVFYLIAFAFGLAGNTLVVYVIAKYDKIRARSVSNYYIWNVAFADELLVLTLPFFCFTTFTNNWPFGVFACKLATVFRESNKFTSVFTLVALSVDRYMATFHQLAAYRQIRTGVSVCVAIWILCLIMSTPYWLYVEIVPNRNGRLSCKVSWPEVAGSPFFYRRLWVYCQLLIGLVIPFAIIATFSALLLRRVRKRQESGPAATGTAAARRIRSSRASCDAAVQPAAASSRLLRRSRVNAGMTRVVMVIVVMFGVFQLPYHIMEVISAGMTPQRVRSLGQGATHALVYCNAVAQMLVFMSSCCNPIVYGILNKNYRTLYTHALCCCCRHRRNNNSSDNIDRQNPRRRRQEVDCLQASAPSSCPPARSTVLVPCTPTTPAHPPPALPSTFPV